MPKMNRGGKFIFGKSVIQADGRIQIPPQAIEEYDLIPYKGRSYCWVDITEQGQIVLTEAMMQFLKLKQAMQLLCIRSNDIALTMGAKGPLPEKSVVYQGDMPLFWRTMPFHLRSRSSQGLHEHPTERANWQRRKASASSFRKETASTRRFFLCSARVQSSEKKFCYPP